MTEDAQGRTVVTLQPWMSPEVGDIFIHANDEAWIFTNYFYKTIQQANDQQVFISTGLAFTRLGDVNRDKHKIKTMELESMASLRKHFPFNKNEEQWQRAFGRSDNKT